MTHCASAAGCSQCETSCLIWLCISLNKVLHFNILKVYIEKHHDVSIYKTIYKLFLQHLTRSKSVSAIAAHYITEPCFLQS